MRRRHAIEPRRVVFIGCEGESERAFARFLGNCCDAEGVRLHLHVKSMQGGDSLSVVEEAGRYLARRPGARDIDARLVLLDQDRMKDDRRAGRDAERAARKHGLQVIVQNPNLEGVLLRLHAGHEQRKVAAPAALAELRKVWPEYRKPPPADSLVERFAPIRSVAGGPARQPVATAVGRSRSPVFARRDPLTVVPTVRTRASASGGMTTNDTGAETELPSARARQQAPDGRLEPVGLGQDL